jgi:hypothetical protein
MTATTGSRRESFYRLERFRLQAPDGLAHQSRIRQPAIDLKLVKSKESLTLDELNGKVAVHISCMLFISKEQGLSMNVRTKL